MTALRSMPYHYSLYWQTPGEVSSMQISDCKGKALALYAQMRRCGAKSVRLVIGKRYIYDMSTHAWLEWKTDEGTYMLDPTFNERAVKTAEIDSMSYIPFYAYDAEHKYRAAHLGALPPNARVATGSADHLYVPPVAAPNYAYSGSSMATSLQSSPTRTQYTSTTTQPQSMYAQRSLYVRRQVYTQSQVQSQTTVAVNSKPVMVTGQRNRGTTRPQDPPSSSSRGTTARQATGTARPLTAGQQTTTQVYHPTPAARQQRLTRVSAAQISSRMTQHAVFMTQQRPTNTQYLMNQRRGGAPSLSPLTRQTRSATGNSQSRPAYQSSIAANSKPAPSTGQQDPPSSRSRGTTARQATGTTSSLTAKQLTTQVYHPPPAATNSVQSGLTRVSSVELSPQRPQHLTTTNQPRRTYLQNSRSASQGFSSCVHRQTSAPPQNKSQTMTAVNSRVAQTRATTTPKVTVPNGTQQHTGPASELSQGGLIAPKGGTHKSELPTHQVRSKAQTVHHAGTG